MPAFLTLIFLCYPKASWTCSLGFMVFSYSWICLNSDTTSTRRRQCLPSSGEWAGCESMCECTAHLFPTQAVGGHTQQLLTLLVQTCTGGAIWHFLPQCGCTGIFLPRWQGDSHSLCTKLSSKASVEMKTLRCLPGHLFRGRTDAVCQDLASEAFEKRGTFWRSTYTRCKHSKNCTWICLSPQFPCRQVLCEISGAALCYVHAS